MTFDFSRRRLLASLGFASLPATATAALATASVSWAPHPAHAKSELTALALEFAPLLEAWLKLDEELSVRGWASHALAERKAGFHPSDGTKYSRENFQIFWEALGEAERELRLDEAEAAVAPYNARLAFLKDRIDALPAKTVSDLQAKAMVALYACRRFWRAPVDGLNFDDGACRRLIEAVCAVTGVKCCEEASVEASA